MRQMPFLTKRRSTVVLPDEVNKIFGQVNDMCDELYDTDHKKMILQMKQNQQEINNFTNNYYNKL